MDKKVLYIGGFCMPDGNSAAQRVLGVGKLLRMCGYEVCFCGLEHNIYEPDMGIIDGFAYTNFPYPTTAFNWLKYLTGYDSSIKEIEKYKPDIVILYNHPALAIERIAKFCHGRDIKVIADVTEWYEPSGNPVFRLIKGFDINRRMQKSHLKLDGLICISNYLADYYKKYKIPILKLPPLVDIKQEKWMQIYEDETDMMKIIYAGSPGASKDRLDIIIKSMSQVVDATDRMIRFDVIGITQQQYEATWKDYTNYDFVTFHGRLSHTDVIKYLLAADFQIFLRPDTLANRAGFPTKFVETITSRTLPITNSNSNLSEYLQDGENGFVIPSLTEFDITSKLPQILAMTSSDIKLLKERIDNQCFDFRNYQKEFIQFIKKL